MEMVRTGTAEKIEAVHKKPFSCGIRNIHRDTRLVVWAIMSNGDRVWLTTIEGGFDKLPIEIKIKMAEAYFDYVIQSNVEYITQEKENDEDDGVYFAVLYPDGYKIDYKALREKTAEWVKKNCNDVFCRISEHRQLGAIKAVETKKLNKEVGQIEAEKIKELENEKLDYRAPADRYLCHICHKAFKPTVKNLVRNDHLVLHKQGKLTGKPILVGNFTLNNNIIKPICHHCAAAGIFIKSFPFGIAEKLKNHRGSADHDKDAEHADTKLILT